MVLVCHAAACCRVSIVKALITGGFLQTHAKCLAVKYRQSDEHVQQQTCRQAAKTLKIIVSMGSVVLLSL